MSESRYLKITFWAGEISIQDEEDPIAIFPCPPEIQEDVYLYLLGSLPHEVLKGIRGAKKCQKQ